MSDSIKIEYNKNLHNLEEVLGDVWRPGNYYINASKVLPMPQIEVEGVGVLAFPLLPMQARLLIEHAIQAPYGRGTETIVDTSVRKVWQISSEQVKISSPSWQESFEAILLLVKDGLGCQDFKVTAELYKMLIYDEGGFFLSHRDTEKSAGMFGTLVVVLPSLHKGGELIVRHAGEEVNIDLSTAGPSELTFAAFYADCEHEIKPIATGNRLCLVYNLIQQFDKKNESSQHPLKAPLYPKEIEEVAQILRNQESKEGSAAKIVWLLEHKYTPAGLSFASLKNGDAALAKVVVEAAKRAEYCIQLGFMHIEESGSAECRYDSYSSRRSRRYWNTDEKENDDHFEIGEIFDSTHYIDGWIPLSGLSYTSGELPLENGELMPQGALDGEEPDEREFSEATGNEGASFERSYHRAVLVLWSQKRHAEVLLQGGTDSVFSYFKIQVNAVGELSPQDSLHAETCTLANRMIQQWPTRSDHTLKMLNELILLKNRELLELFIEKIIIEQYDTSAEASLLAAFELLNNATIDRLLDQLIERTMPNSPPTIASLLLKFVEFSKDTQNAKKAATTVINAFTKIKKDRMGSIFWHRQHSHEQRLVTEQMVVDLWNALFLLKDDQLFSFAISEIINLNIFDPRTVITPALSLLQKQQGIAINKVSSFLRLWQHAAESLLSKSELPPTLPTDWKQKFSPSCKCDDCKSLQIFCLDPTATTHRFRVRKDRRDHLRAEISREKLDMETFTEESSSTHTLICNKTRHSYEKSCQEHALDIDAMKVLNALHCADEKDFALLQKRMKTTIECLQK